MPSGHFLVVDSTRPALAVDRQLVLAVGTLGTQCQSVEGMLPCWVDSEEDMVDSEEDMAVPPGDMEPTS